MVDQDPVEAAGEAGDPALPPHLRILRAGVEKLRLRRARLRHAAPRLDVLLAAVDDACATASHNSAPEDSFCAFQQMTFKRKIDIVL